jgi:hypothetical protein
MGDQSEVCFGKNAQWTNCLCSVPAGGIYYTLNYLSGSNGYLTGSTTQSVAQGDNGSAVTAIANGGYIFQNWSDASTTNPRVDYNVQSDITVTANFVSSSTTPPISTSTTLSCSPDLNNDIGVITSCSIATSGITYTNYNSPGILYFYMFTLFLACSIIYFIFKK